MSAVIGIDLGTCNSCVAVYLNNKVEIIPSEIGNNTTPSYVAYQDDDSVVIGDSAKCQANINPSSSIFDVKLLIGRRFSDPVVQKEIKYWPFQVVEGRKHTPVIKLPNGKTLLPEQISAYLLSNLKKQAEEYLGNPVENAVITVPAYFNDGQRQATKDAGEIAGLNVLRIINEPTAAAIAYNFQRKSPDLKTILVFDLGGGTFDVSILKIQGSDIEVLAVGGDTHLGGEDFDNAIVEYCIEDFKNKYQKLSLPTSVQAFNQLRRLKNECGKAKIILSSIRRTPISLEAFHLEKNMHVLVTRETFESLNQKSFDKCIQTMDKVIKDVNLTTEDIDEVILVGDSSEIPGIQARITTYFDGKRPLHTIKSDEVVAYGAALQASMLSPESESPEQDIANFENPEPVFEILREIRSQNTCPTDKEVCLNDVEFIDGRMYNDPVLQEDEKLWPSQSVNDEDNLPDDKLTKLNCEDLLLTIFTDDDQKPLVQNVIAQNLSECISSSTGLEDLGDQLRQKGLIVDTQLEEFKAKSTELEKSEFLLGILQKEVVSKEQYLILFEALFETINQKVVEQLFEAIKRENLLQSNLSIAGNNDAITSSVVTPFDNEDAQVSMAPTTVHESYWGETTRNNCLEFLFEIFSNDRRIPLINVILHKITYFVLHTVSPELLGLQLLQEKNLIHYTQLARLKAMSVSYDQSWFLYTEVLNKVVEHREQYEGLLKALFDSGNGHIANKLLEILKSRQLEASDENENKTEPVTIVEATTTRSSIFSFRLVNPRNYIPPQFYPYPYSN